MTTGGTHNSDDWFLLEAGSFAQVPRSGGAFAVREPLAFTAISNAALPRHEDALAAALLILSQSDTGRRLIETARAQGYAIAIDPPVIGGAGSFAEAKAQGSADHVEKRINLKGTDDPLALALTLAHEMTHISQIAKGGAPAIVSEYHPLAMLRLLLAMEADARAHEFAVAFELAYAKPGDPEQRLLFPQAIDAALASIDNSATHMVVGHFRPQFPGDDMDAMKEGMMARVFKTFYAAPAMRRAYEATVLHSIATLEANNPGELQDNNNFRRGATAAEIIAMVDSDMVYASKAAKFLDLDGGAVLAVWPDALQKFAQLELIRRENPATRNDRPWTDAPDMSAFLPQKKQEPKGPTP